jgi:hypothetical protein
MLTLQWSNWWRADRLVGVDEHSGLPGRAGTGSRVFPEYGWAGWADSICRQWSPGGLRDGAIAEWIDAGDREVYSFVSYGHFTRCRAVTGRPGIS